MLRNDASNEVRRLTCEDPPRAAYGLGGGEGGMREILDYCSGGTRRAAPAGTEVIHEGGTPAICSC